MKKILFLFTILLISNIETGLAFSYESKFLSKIETQKDSIRLAELDRYWSALAKTVKEGDFEGYKSAYHEDAVVIFATGKNKTSVSISKALEDWKAGFMKTKEGEQNDNVEFQFSKRIGDETTAHETGIFRFKSKDTDGKLIAEYTIHFEMLLIKREGKWHGVMEYQKTIATDEEWKTLK
jgi:ketosteroid isomerase-like protein